MLRAARSQRRRLPNAILSWLLWSWLVTPIASAQTFTDEFSASGDRLNRSVWTTEIGNGSFLGRTQLRDWVTEDGVGRFVVTDGAARLALDTFNPTGHSLYGTHAKTRASFQPSATADVVLTARMRLTDTRRGIVYGLYFYGCGASCASDHDEIDIELVTNFLQGGAPLASVQLNRYAAEPLGAGHGVVVTLPAGFDPLAYHEWKIRWSLGRITYFVDSVALFSTTTFVPQRPMHADVIAWGPSSEWSGAFDASLQPTSDPSANQSFVALVDRVDIRTLPVFTEAPLVPQSSIVRATHVRELRQHVDAVRMRHGMTAFEWTNPAIAAASTLVQARHIEELRTALAAVYGAMGLGAPVYSGTGARGAAIRAADIEELRAAVMAVE